MNSSLSASSACLLAGILCAQETAAEPHDLQAELRALVAVSDAAERRARADELARERGITVEQWRQAIAAFTPRDDEVGPGTRTVRTPEGEAVLHVPARPGRGPCPILLAGHGTGGRAQQAIATWQAVAEEVGMAIVAPVGGELGWGFTGQEREQALAALRRARLELDVDENRIFVTGISRGGHMTWDLVLRHPDRFAGAAPIIGGPRLSLAGGQNNLRYLENVAHLSIRDLQGDRDDPLLIENLELAFGRLEEFGARDARWIRFPELGHSFELAAVDWNTFFGEARRDPVPRTVVRMAANPAEARSFWVEILAFRREVAEEFPLRVDARTWDALDEAGRRAYLADMALERTARLQVTMREPGRFEAEGAGVGRFRLLLTEAMLDGDGRVEVRCNGRTVRRRPKADASVLLREFAERFDRTFLPAYEVAIR